MRFVIAGRAVPGFSFMVLRPLPLDYADRPPKFTTENGYRIWINRREN